MSTAAGELAVAVENLRSDMTLDLVVHGWAFAWARTLVGADAVQAGRRHGPDRGDVGFPAAGVPPLNLQVTILDVAEQPASAGTDLDCNRAVLASAEADGVHYMWWLAVRRRYFTVEQGQACLMREAAFAVEPTGSLAHTDE